MGQKVFDMRSFDEFKAAALDERDVAPRELDLQVEGVETGAEQHRDFSQWRALFMDLQNALRDESRLRILIHCLGQYRRRPVLLAREQGLGIFLSREPDHFIRQAE